MALSSASTVADALAQYNDNLSWEGNITKASAALEAVRFLLTNRGLAISAAGRQINFPDLERQQARLESFIDAVGIRSSRSPFTVGKPV